MAEINLDDISSNSDSAKHKQNALPGPVEETDVIKVSPLKRQNLLARGLAVFGVSTDFSGALKTVWEDVIIPTFLDGCRDSMYPAADYIFGGTGARRNHSSKSSGGKSGYTSYSNASKNNRVVKKSPATNSYYIEYEERQSNDPNHPGAQDVLDGMFDVLDQIHFVTIQDMITIAKKTTTNYTLGDWGWKDLSRAMVRRAGNGMYYIDLPRPVEIGDK